MLRLCFFGTFKGFCNEYGLGELKESDFLKAFQAELQAIASATKAKNPSLFETSRQLKESKGSKNYLGSFYALYLQEQEFRIVEALLKHIMNQTPVMNVEKTSKKSAIYEYDGIKLLKVLVDSHGGKQQFIQFLNEKTRELTGFALTWEEKEFQAEWNIAELIGSVNDDCIEDESLIELENKYRAKFNDVGVIEIVQEILPNQFVYNNKEWKCWDGARWLQNDRPLRSAITYKVADYLLENLEPYKVKYMSLEDDNINKQVLQKLYEKTEKFVLGYLRNHNHINAIVGEGKNYLANDELEFDANPYLFGCKNGVWDFTEEIFRPYRFDDYVTWSCGYDFVPQLASLKYIEIEDGEEVIFEITADPTGTVEKHYAELETVFRQIFPDPDVLLLVMIILSSGLVGKAIEKFFIFNGKGRNGKGLVNEFMQVVLGDYFTYVDPVIFTENQKQKSSKDANPALAQIHNKRLLVTKEPAADRPLQNNVVKDMTGGGDMQGRMLYSCVTRIKLVLTGIMETNVKPPFAETPTQADAERIVDIHFGSFFTADSTLWDQTTGQKNNVFPLNPALKDVEWFNKNKNMMLNILVRYLFLLKKSNFIIDEYICESVKIRSLEYLQESNDLHVIFQNLFVVYREEDQAKYKNDKGQLENNDWTLAKIVAAIRASKEFKDLPKSKKSQFTATKSKEFFETNHFYKPFVNTNSSTKQTYLVGWRRRLEDDTDSTSLPLSF